MIQINMRHDQTKTGHADEKENNSLTNIEREKKSGLINEFD